MWDRVYKKRQGCLLAHSMGLGKTVQTIALLTTMFQQLKRYPSTQFPAVR
jgi:SNF2 family DNA or RNA helicase